jgi:hypothetical protein
MIVTDETRRVRYDVGLEIFLGGRETGNLVTVQRTNEGFQAPSNAVIIINNGNQKFLCHDMLQIGAGLLGAAHRSGDTRMSCHLTPKNWVRVPKCQTNTTYEPSLI